MMSFGSWEWVGSAGLSGSRYPARWSYSCTTTGQSSSQYHGHALLSVIVQILG